MNIRTLQENLGHEKLETTEIYLHVARAPESEVSPLDSLLGDPSSHCGTQLCAACHARIESELEQREESTRPRPARQHAIRTYETRLAVG